jgi:hypothetical protein
MPARRFPRRANLDRSTGFHNMPVAMIRLTAALAAVYLAVSVVPAFAETEQQKQAEAEADAMEAAKRAQTNKEEAAKAPPPAIPGAVSSSEVAPPLKSAADLSPNDALFDAINRGDAGAARDAMNRGAQLDAKNVLGETPIDAAIESNRNDITFLLLSLRGAQGTAAPRHALVQTASAPAAHSRHKAAHAQVAVARAAAPADPGTPNPAVGFNGF